MIVPFYDWLTQQRDRADGVGEYARRVLRDTRFPRSNRLYVLLKYAQPAWRPALKRAHREWRRAQ